MTVTSEPVDRAQLHEVERLARREVLHDVHEDEVAEGPLGQDVGGRLADASRADDRDLLAHRLLLSSDRFSIGTKSRLSSPRYTWRGRAIFCSLSSTISSHWASQPDMRPIAKSTGNMSTGKPMAW